MSFRIISSESVPLTRELAEEFRDMPKSATERDYDPKRVDRLKKKWQDGRLVPFHWATARLHGKELRMNGQHSTDMLC